jgi:cytidylate kinase
MKKRNSDSTSSNISKICKRENADIRGRNDVENIDDRDMDITHVMIDAGDLLKQFIDIVNQTNGIIIITINSNTNNCYSDYNNRNNSY